MDKMLLSAAPLTRPGKDLCQQLKHNEIKHTDMNINKIRICSWNVNTFRKFQKSLNKNILLTLKADVICLQEPRINDVSLPLFASFKH